MSYKRVNTDWMRSNFGISAHWTSRCVMQDGTRLPYEEAVDRFSVDRFADALASAGAQHCIFTLTHADQCLAMPNEVLERILPGRTAKRDLIGEIIEALRKRGIRFLAYYNHSCNDNDDLPWKKACGYADGIHGDLDRFAQNICDVVSWISRRYGDGISGWWFDSAYSVDPDGPYNRVTCEMGDWKFPWKKLNEAAKSGNPESAVAFNAGFGTYFMYSDFQDYYCGETVKLNEVYTLDPLPDMGDHRWICADSLYWVFNREIAANGFADPRFTDEEVKAFTEEHLQAGRMVTWNVLIDQAGNFNPKQLAQFKRIFPS